MACLPPLSVIQGLLVGLPHGCTPARLHSARASWVWACQSSHTASHLAPTPPAGSSFLARILGLFQVTVRVQGMSFTSDVLVMENVLHNRNVSRLYDLKGSLRSRYRDPSTLGHGPGIEVRVRGGLSHPHSAETVQRCTDVGRVCHWQGLPVGLVVLETTQCVFPSHAGPVG